MFIGEKKIKGTLDIGNGLIQISFKNCPTDITINKNLFDIIKSDKIRNGDVTDMVRLVLSTKILTDFAEYGLDFYMVDHIGQGIRTLAHNMREELFSKTFDCAGMDDIKIKKLLANYETKDN